MRSRPALRWLVPAAAAVVVIGGGAAIGTFAAAAEPTLPPRSAAQLLVDLQTARLNGLSGTVVTRADLGLPALPNVGQATSDLTSLVSGTHTLRVWYAGPQQARAALLGTLGESDVIRNGKDVWLWNSQTNTATHQTLAADSKSPTPPTGLPSTPQQAADQALAAINPTTQVSVGRSARIAGRDAYELVLGPRDTGSLVGQVRIAIDAKEHVPLRFEVFAKGSDQPAFQVAFTQVTFGRPNPAQFTFNPPPGAKVTTQSGTPEQQPAGAGMPTGQWKIVGTGWTSVVVAHSPQPAAPKGGAPAEQGTGTGADQVTGMLNQLPKVSGSWGTGRLVTGKLFSALLTDDGRVLVGAVSPDRLYQAAQGTR
jgi:outer membrane lipoprotein-sorting protein